MTLAQLEASILALPVPTDAAAYSAYRAELRRLEAEYDAAIQAPLDLDELDDLVEETRPAVQPYDGQAWDEHCHRAATIARIYA